MKSRPPLEIKFHLKKRHVLLPILLGIVIPIGAIMALVLLVAIGSSLEQALAGVASSIDLGYELVWILLWNQTPFLALVGLTALISIRIRDKRLDFLSFGGLMGVAVTMIIGYAYYLYRNAVGSGDHTSDTIGVGLIPLLCVVPGMFGSLLGWAAYYVPFLSAPQKKS